VLEEHVFAATNPTGRPYPYSFYGNPDLLLPWQQQMYMDHEGSTGAAGR
jgi:hypothetical protein